MARTPNDRRTVLKTGLAAGLAGLAGCTGQNNDQGNGTTQTTNSGSSGTTSSDSQTPQSLPRGGHMRVAWGQGMQSLSPFKGYKADYLAKETMYDRLTRVDRDFKVHPNLAKKWETNDDYTEYTFHLQKNATFANTGGQKVLAEDVKATVDFMRSDKCSGCEKDLSPLKSVQVVDDHTIKFTLKRSDTEYPRRISETGSTFCIAPKNVLEDDPSKLEQTDYGSGPFTVTNWQKGNSTTFKASDSYHLAGVDGKPLPYLDKMTWKVQPDQIARANMLTDGRADSLSRLPAKLTNKVKGQAKITQRTSGLQMPIVLNTTIKPFQSLAVRQAMKYGMDRKEMLAAISNRGAIGHHSPITPIHKYYDDSLDKGHMFGTTAKPKKAKQKLKEAGHGGGLELPALFYDTGRPEKQVIAQVFKQQMQKIGITFKIKRLTEQNWLSNHWNKDDTWYVGNWSTRVVDSTIPLLAMHSDGKWNTARWSNKEYDKTLEKAVAATDESERAKLLAKCQKINHEKGAWLETVFPDIFGAYNKNVQNYELYPTLIKDHLQYAAISQSN